MAKKTKNINDCLIETDIHLMKICGISAVGVALFLIMIKGIGWYKTQSIAILSSLTDSTLDMIASSVNLIALFVMMRPATSTYRFGFNKAEPLASLMQAAFIIGSAIFILLESTQRLIHPRPLENTTGGLIVMGLSLIITISLVIFQKYVTRRTNSLIIKADALHYTGDILSNIAVIGSLIAFQIWGWITLDAMVGIGIGLYLIYNALGIIRESITSLMDRELPEKERRKIIKITEEHKKVKEIHDLKTRKAGHVNFIQFHIELDPKMSLEEAHDVADEVQWEIEKKFPCSEIVIHMDPYTGKNKAKK